MNAEERTVGELAGVAVHAFDAVIAAGAAAPKKHVPPTPNDLATICYTSGTTGWGFMLMM